MSPWRTCSTMIKNKYGGHSSCYIPKRFFASQTRSRPTGVKVAVQPGRMADVAPGLAAGEPGRQAGGEPQGHVLVAAEPMGRAGRLAQRDRRRARPDSTAIFREDPAGTRYNITTATARLITSHAPRLKQLPRRSLLGRVDWLPFEGGSGRYSGGGGACHHVDGLLLE